MTTSLDFGVAKEMALVEAKIRRSIVSEEPLLHDIARYVIDAGGKRIRPMVTLLAFRALGGTDVSQAIDLAAALELIHSATLIHDDIIPRKPALPIMAGAKITGLIARARLEDIEAVGEYGLNLGIAFQIVDDILDVVGDGARLGKRTGTDLREGNVTLVAIHALNDGTSIDVRSLERLIAKRRKREEDVQRGLGLLRDSGAIEKARAEAFAFGQLAKKALDPLPESDAKASMVQLVDYVLSRES